MTLEAINKELDVAATLLNDNRIIAAIDILEKIAKDLNDYRSADLIKQMRQTYGYLLHYLVEGVDDPSRVTMRSDIIETLRGVSDDLKIAKMQVDSPTVYFSTKRICEHRNLEFSKVIARILDTNSNIQLAEIAQADASGLYSDRENLLRQLFDLVWTARKNSEMADSVRKLLADSRLTPELWSYLISALTLSLAGWYDRSKFELLIDIYDADLSEQVSAKALVGIVIAADKHRKRVGADPKIMMRLSSWEDSILTFSRLRDVVKEIVRTRDTDRITEKMREEVIPELIKMRPEIIKKMKGENLDFESGIIENNPEWEEMLEKNGIAGKIRELTEMQNEGADLMMVTFSNLKSFPFFNNANSWFLPFIPNLPSLKLDENLSKTLTFITENSAEMCDSDKYSLALAFTSMPEEQRNMMKNQFEAQFSQMAEQLQEQLEKNSRPEFILSATKFIRELYRFFKLFRKKNEFEDPFARPFDFAGIPGIGKMTSDEEIVTLMSEFYFKRGYWAEALSLFKILEDKQADTGVYWEKKGFCEQSMQDYDSALDSYRKAEMLKEPGDWLIKKIAFVLRKTARFHEAAEYYERALTGDEDNVSLIMNAGHSRFEAGETDAALRHYYHANYLSPSNPKIWRSIAWAELYAGNTDKSLDYYGRIEETGADAMDYLNQGHAYLLAKNYKDALSSYRKSRSISFEKFEKNFNTDRETLLMLGADRLQLDLMRDAIEIS